MMGRQRGEEHDNHEKKETDEDDVTIRSAGDEASIGDDASATSNISDIDFDNEITFFGGIDA